MANKKERTNAPQKHWLTTLILCWFLGFFGVHRMYAGRVGSGLVLLYWTFVSALVTYLNVYLGISCFVCVGAVVVNDFVLIVMRKFKDCYGREISKENLG